VRLFKEKFADRAGDFTPQEAERIAKGIKAK
jgi:hypothetical protein